MLKETDLMDNFQIETAQNVNISQNVAGVGERILAYFIDSFIIVIYIFAISLVFSVFDVNDSVYFIIVMTIGLPIFLYHLLWETLWDGRSPGKAALKLRVVKLDGSKPAFSNFLLRWLLRIIDISLSAGGLALVTLLFNGRGQRLGDIAATTTVITEKKIITLSQTLLEDIASDYQPTYSQVTVFSDAEIQEIKTIFNEAKRHSNHQIILKLSQKISSIMEISFQETPIHFIQTVLKDYNYFTQRS